MIFNEQRPGATGCTAATVKFDGTGALKPEILGEKRKADGAEGQV